MSTKLFPINYFQLFPFSMGLPNFTGYDKRGGGRETGSMRRLFHLIKGSSLFLILAYSDRTKGILLILSLFIVTIIIETIRLYLPGVNRLFFHYFHSLLRGEEKKKLTGTAYFLGGVLLSILLFDVDIALFSITILTVGDPAASTIGKRWGRHRIKGKSLEGSMAFLISAMIMGLILQRLWPGLPATVIIVGALTGTLTELLSTKVNDNLLIPLAAAGAMGTVLFLLNLVHLD